MIIYGDEKGSAGILLSIDGPDGVIKLDKPESRDEISMNNIRHLCKMAV